MEIHTAVFKAKREKACGIDGIPSDVFRNDCSVSFLHILFNVCFTTGVIPTEWGKGIINPIPKSNTSDPRDPLSYRGITLAPTTYKLYCSVLNERLDTYFNHENTLVDEQNGFRKSRSTIDHVSNLTNLIETRIKRKLSTYAAFIDFKKAYDSIDRDLLWQKLTRVGVKGKMLRAVQSRYNSVSSCVRINGYTTDWFEVNVGLRQGCPLSPLLFNCFINDLALKIKAVAKGVPLDDDGDERICIMLYADDIVLIGENERDLQAMLDELSVWCETSHMQVNHSKSKVVHYRPESTERSSVKFNCCSANVEIVDKYVYLGLTIQEHMDWNIMAKVVAQSANRALGLLIAKSKALGGMPYNISTKLFDSMVWSVISYGAAVWGTRKYSCIDAVQMKAQRFFLGTGKYTPSDAVAGDMGWVQTFIRQYKSVCNQWTRYSNMMDDRVNKRIFNFCQSKSGARCQNWHYRVTKHLSSNGCADYIQRQHRFSSRQMFNTLSEHMMNTFTEQWHIRVNSHNSRSGNGGNKLRTYKLFKTTYQMEQYCKTIMPTSHRSAFAKFRCGVAPLRLETGRYEGLTVNERICPFCRTQIETEIHVITQCKTYESIRDSLFQKACVIYPDFNILTDEEKMVFLFSNQSMIRECAKTCWLILQRRSALLYK